MLLQLAAIIEESHDAIIGTMLDGTIVSWNGGAAKMSGYSFAEVAGKSMTDLFLPELKDPLLELVEKVRLGEVVSDYEATWTYKNGICVDVGFSLSPIHSSTGAIVGISLVGRDISARKKVEESMRQAQRIIDSSYDAIISEALDATVVSWNKGAEKMFGYTAQEIIGQSILVLLPPGQEDEGPALLAKIRSGETLEDADVVRLRKDGTKIDIALSISPIRTKEGVLVGASVIERDITMRKKAEQLMRQVQLVVDNSHEAIIGIIGEARNGIITSWNGGATNMLGYSSQEAVGQPMSFLLPEEKKAEAAALLERVVAGETIADHTSVWLRKDGIKIDVALSMAPIKNVGGTIIGVSIVERDITSRKKTEDLMRQTQLLVENSHDAIISGTADHTITSWNGGATQMLGYTAEEALGKSFDIFVPPERRDAVVGIVQRIFAGENIAAYDGAWVRKDGTRVEMSISLSSVKLDDGSVANISIVGRDITLRKKMEDTMRQTQLIVENSHDAILSTTLEGNIVSWNNGAVLMTGFPAPEVLGKRFDFLIPPERIDAVTAVLRRIAEGEIVADYGAVWLHKSGTLVNVEISISPLKTGDGTVTGVSVVGRDMTEHKKTEQRIKELSDMRSKFITIISHQLRTPLTAVNWNLESILDGDFGVLEETTRKFLQITHRSSVEITHRIYDLLSAMDIEEGRVVYKSEKTALDSMVVAIVNDLQKKCELKNISLQYAASATNVPEVEVDSEKIRTVIAKMIENAVMYTKEGGKIVVKLEVHDAMIHFEVGDTGIGIPASEQHHIFSRFFRASNASVMQPDAFGLGLFISKSFVEQHGGTVGFISTEGAGSVFWFEIPLTVH